MTAPIRITAVPAALAVLLLAWGGCGLTITNDTPSYEELPEEDKRAVDIIYQELRKLDLQVEDRSRAMFSKSFNLAPVVDKQAIDVSFDGMMMAYNLGDGLVHVAAWDHLTNDQRLELKAAFGGSMAQARARYEKLFYRVMAASQGIKQYMYNLHTPERVFSKFSIFNLELHPMRTAMGYFEAVGRRADIWSFTSTICATPLKQGKARWGHMFTPAQSGASPSRFPKAKQFMRDNYELFIRGDDPLLNLYFICQWTVIGKDESEGFNAELRWLHTKIHES